MRFRYLKAVPANYKNLKGIFSIKEGALTFGPFILKPGQEFVLPAHMYSAAKEALKYLIADGYFEKVDNVANINLDIEVQNNEPIVEVQEDSETKASSDVIVIENNALDTAETLVSSDSSQAEVSQEENISNEVLDTDNQSEPSINSIFYTAEELSEMTVSQLKQLITDAGWEIPAGARKADLIRFILEHHVTKNQGLE